MKTPLRSSILALLAFAALLTSLRQTRAQVCEVSGAPWQWLWVGPPGATWGQLYNPPASNWGTFPGTKPGCSLVPDGTISDVYINEQQSNGTVQGTPLAAIAADTGYTVGRLSIGSTSKLAILNGASLRLASETGTSSPWYDTLAQTLVNYGEITLTNSGGGGGLVVGPGPRNGLELTGGPGATGKITMQNGMIGGQYQHPNLGLHNYRHTIHGVGELGGGFNLNFSNWRLKIDNDEGLIEADQNGGTLYVHVTGEQCTHGSRLTNRNGGILSARNGGILFLVEDSGCGSTFIDNHTGIVSATDGGIVRLGFTTVLQNGVVNTSNGGTIRGPGTLRDLTSNALVVADNAEPVRLVGSIINNGTVLVQSGGTLLVRNGLTVSGPGEISLPNGYPTFINAEGGLPAAVSLASGQRLHGAGQISEIDFNLNGGTIDADSTIGKELNVILRYEGNEAIRNNAGGMLRASNSGQLWLTTPGGGTAIPSRVVNDAANGAVIRADDNGIVRVRDGKTIVQGAHFITSGNGRISGAEPFGGLGWYLGFTNDGLVASGANEGCNLGGVITNRGTIAALGTMFLGNAWGVTSFALTNTGTLRASGGVFEANGTGSITNNSVIEALDGGTFRLVNGATLTNLSNGTLAGGTYRVISNDSASALQLNAGPITTNAATIILSGANAQFPGLSSLTQNNGTLVLDNGATLSVNGTLAAQRTASATAATFPNAGTISLGNGSTLTVNGDYSQGANSVLEVVIGGAYPQNFNALKVSGTAKLAGSLLVKLANGYVPGLNDTVPILSAAGIEGGFTSVSGATVTYGPNGVSVHPTGNTNALQMISAASRKMHGTVGAFDIPLPGIECRRSANDDHTLVFTFSNALANASAQYTNSGNTFGASRSIAGNTLTVDLAGIADQQRVTVTLSGISDVYSQTLPDTAITLTILRGDVSDDSFVNSGDSSVTRSLSGQLANATSFRADVNTDGAVNSGDAMIVRSASGHSVP